MKMSKRGLANNKKLATKNDENWPKHYGMTKKIQK